MADKFCIFYMFFLRLTGGVFVKGRGYSPVGAKIHGDLNARQAI